MGFLAGLLPGLLVGVLIGFTMTTIARHARELAKGLIKLGLLLGDGLGKVGRSLQARLGELVAEARSDLDRQADVEGALPPERRGPQPPRGPGGPFP